MPDQIDRNAGRGLFGFDPAGYDATRPDYPPWIFDRLRDCGALTPGAATLEIGPGSGKATRELLAYGADPLTLVEPDARFIAHLESTVCRFAADCRIVRLPFEEVSFTDEFDLVAAATMFHWLDQVAALRRIRRSLRPGGFAALFWNLLQDLDKEDAFHEATRRLLAPLATSPAGAPDTVPFALNRAAREAEAVSSGFARVEYFESRWTLTLDTQQIGKLYEGFSSIQLLDPEPRSALLRDLMTIADRQFDGTVERNVTSCLYLLSEAER